jgi:hypothetical protein
VDRGFATIAPELGLGAVRRSLFIRDAAAGMCRVDEVKVFEVSAGTFRRVECAVKPKGKKPRATGLTGLRQTPAATIL